MRCAGHPKPDLVEPLGRDCLTRQVEVVDQANDLALARSHFSLLECFDDIRQLAGRSVGGHTVFTVDLALHRALTQTISTSQDPAEDRLVLSRSCLRVRQAQQVAVRPTVALLVLHHLVSQLVGFLLQVPAANRVAETAAPTAQSIHILGEVEQVGADAADLGQVLEGQSLGFGRTVSGHQGERKHRRVVLGARPLSRLQALPRDTIELEQRTIASWFCFTRSRSVM
jgi:hypothetical protein